MESVITYLIEVEEHKNILELHEEASSYLKSHTWCSEIVDLLRYGFGG